MSDALKALVRLGAPLATRVRRGKTVIIPFEWVGEVAHPQQIRQRQSKFPAKQRKSRSVGGYHGPPGSGHPRTWAPRLTRNRRNPETDE